jgi:hypothetical protein
MRENNNTKNVLLCAFLIVAAVLSRIVNLEFHLWGNFACIGAISLFSGNIIKNKSYAYLIPLVAYFVSDLYIMYAQGQQGFYGVSQFFVYGAMMLVVLLGTKMGDAKAIKVFGFSLAGSAIFWLVSNFGVWFANVTMAETSPMHEAGLTLGFTYFRALPFYNSFSSELFLGTFVGDLAYSTLLFGSYALLKNKLFAPKAIAG